MGREEDITEGGKRERVHCAERERERERERGREREGERESSSPAH